MGIMFLSLVGRVLYMSDIIVGIKLERKNVQERENGVRLFWIKQTPSRLL
jgi:hypothetical protein